MRKLSLSKTAGIVLVLCAMTGIPSLAQTFTTLVNFNGTNGNSPQAGLVQGTDGNFYGTTFSGGTSNAGTVFRMTHGGTLTTIHSFDGTHGWAPFAGLAQGTDGNFYGTTAVSGVSGGACGTEGCGIVFKVTPAGTFTTLYSFCSLANCVDGYNCSPNDCGTNVYAGLTQGTDGNFYGTTNAGGAHTGGTVFKITSAGTFTTLYSFCSLTNCADGDTPFAALTQATGGNFYGTTSAGGAHDAGTVFEITPGGTLTTLYRFCQTNCTDGAEPLAGLVQAIDGNFYGTTMFGGISNQGTVFKITPAGQLTTLYNFCSQHNSQGYCTDGAQPFTGLAQGTDGNLYGTTSGGFGFGFPACGSQSCGTIFKITPAGQLTTLYSFNFCSNSLCLYGAQPSGLIQATDGNFYGTTRAGGANGLGTVFSLAVGLGNVVLLDAPSAGGSYYGMYCSTCIAASFTLTAADYVSAINIVVRTPATTSFTTFDFALQNSLTAPITTFASQALTAPVGAASTVSLNVGKTLPAGTYYLVGNVIGYFGTPVTPGDVDGWLLSTGVYNNAAGTITNGLWSFNGSTWTLTSGAAPAFSVNGVFRVTKTRKRLVQVTSE